MSARGIGENVIAGLIILGLSWLVSQFDVGIQLWVAVLIAGVFAVVAYRVGRNMRGEDDLAARQADHLYEVIPSLREFAAGVLESSFDDLIERGILGPACYGLSVVNSEEIRASVLALDGSGENFEMLYEAGHSVGRKSNFSLPRASLAGHALESKQLQWTDDVDEDDRWQVHPLAKEKRKYISLASAPILVGADAVAVLNVVSTERAAFLKGDLTYIEILASLIALAWDLNASSGAGSNLAVDE